MLPEGSLLPLLNVVSARLGLSVQKSWPARLTERLGADLPEDGLEEFASRMEREGLETPRWKKTISAVTNGETRFLRQESWFQQIQKLAIIPLIHRRRNEKQRTLRLWSAGCSTGEEPFTLAVLLRDLLPDYDQWRVEILATDIREEAIEAAERGEYDRRQLREFSDHQISRYFVRGGSRRFTVVPEIRRSVKFHLGNLAELPTDPVDGSFAKYDLILCRNVLMYMAPEVQRHIAAYLVAALSDHGWLAVSPAEASADWFKPLTPVNTPEAVLFTKVLETRRNAPSVAIDAAPMARHAPKAKDKAPSSPVASRAVDHRPLLLELRSLADQGALVEAKSRCHELLEVDPLNGEAAVLLAEICSELNDAPGAYAAAARAVYLLPSSPQAHLLLAGALSKMGRSARARKAMAAAHDLVSAGSATAVGIGAKEAANPPRPAGLSTPPPASRIKRR